MLNKQNSFVCKAETVYLITTTSRDDTFEICFQFYQTVSLSIILFTLPCHKRIQLTIFITKLFKSRRNSFVHYFLWIYSINFFLIILY